MCLLSEKLCNVGRRQTGTTAQQVKVGAEVQLLQACMTPSQTTGITADFSKALL